jgi:hypothetical protein
MLVGVGREEEWIEKENGIVEHELAGARPVRDGLQELVPGRNVDFFRNKDPFVLRV